MSETFSFVVITERKEKENLGKLAGEKIKVATVTNLVTIIVQGFIKQ